MATKKKTTTGSLVKQQSKQVAAPAIKNIAKKITVPKKTTTTTKPKTTFTKTGASLSTKTPVQAISDAITSVAETNARAAAAANAASAQAQADQYAYNSALQEQAQSYNSAAMASQQNFDTISTAQANALTREWYEQQMAFNAEQADINRTYQTGERLAAQEFNASEAQKLRDWQEKMSGSAIQRQMADLKKAGLNPILAAGYGGANIGSGAAGSTAGMSGATANAGSISAARANSAMASSGINSVGNYTGTLENTSNELALFGAIASGLSTALEGIGLINENGGVSNQTKKVLHNMGYVGNEGIFGNNGINMIKRWWKDKTGKNGGGGGHKF